MSRDGSGDYALPLPPVTTGTTIEASWANTTLDDVKAALTDSLSRAGSGGMSAPLKLVDGTVSAPSWAFSNETNSGFYRNAVGDIRFSLQGNDKFRFNATSGIQVYGDALWKTIFAGEVGTVTSQTARWDNTNKQWVATSNWTVDATGNCVAAGTVTANALVATTSVSAATASITGVAELQTEIVLTERADHSTTPVATKGIVWVRNDSPCVLIFTDDQGTDHQIQNPTTQVTKVGVPVDNQVGVWTGDGTIEGSNALLFDGTTLTVTGNVAVTGTVDGRDIAAMGTKLDGIESGATADQTGAEIKTLLFAEADTNNFDDAAQTKLAGIEAAADVTDETNVKSALNGATIAGATVASTDKVLLQDVDDSDNLKTATAMSVAQLLQSSGTWTPTIEDTTTEASESQTYTSQNGTYTKIGDWVFFAGEMTVSSVGSLSPGGCYIGGLPFDCENTSGAYYAISIGSATSLNIITGQAVTGFVVPGSSAIQLDLWDSAGGTTPLLVSEFSNGGQVIVSGFYKAA